jgi:hypothetical protein
MVHECGLAADRPTANPIQETGELQGKDDFEFQQNETFSW